MEQDGLKSKYKRTKEDLKAEKPTNVWKLLKSFFFIIALQEKQNFAVLLSVKKFELDSSVSQCKPQTTVSLKNSLHFSKSL